MYEGEYLEGERDGKGKEYDISGGIVEFEGTYSKGNKWNGDAIEIDEDGAPVFVGKYINGIKIEEEGENLNMYKSESDEIYSE